MIFIYVGLILSLQCCYSLGVSLGSYGADPATVSVSGISSGGAMAVQLHVTYSSELMGVGQVSGLPYYCAKGSLVGADTCMYTPYMNNPDNFVQEANDNAAAGLVDPTSNLAGNKVYIYAGTKDTVVNPTNGKNSEQFYQAFGSNILSEYTIASQHCHPTVNYGNGCAMLGSPYISSCNYNAAYILLNHIYGGGLVEPTGTVTLTGSFYEYDQAEFISGTPDSISMDTTGYAYVPTYCQTNPGCKFHIALHGCEQGRVYLNDEYARHTGYNEVAELNNIIVIYPQATKTSALGSNPNGCWDWWGYTDNNYANNQGVQMIAIHKMMDRVLTNSFTSWASTTISTGTTKNSNANITTCQQQYDECVANL